MIGMSPRFVAAAAVAAALMGVCTTASAQGPRHEVRKLEMKLHRLEAKKQFDISHRKRRAAARTEAKIEATRAEIRSIRH